MYLEDYHKIHAGEVGFYSQKRGLIAVWGKEAEQFLNGLMTNDVARLEGNAQMAAAFPNAQGRLIALVRIKRDDQKFFIETESATREKLFQNLFRFTMAGDFFVEDLSENFQFLEIHNSQFTIHNSVSFETKSGQDIFVPKDAKTDFLKDAIEISEELHEVLRIEQGIPLYGVDMDETTVVPEIGIENLISYNKGCYIGQEIIARIHFRGHVAKQLTGLILSEKTDSSALTNAGLKSPEGKNAGKITSATFSPKLDQTIALAYVRYEFLAEGTELKAGEISATVKNLPFIER